jgi:hypothetical protein
MDHISGIDALFVVNIVLVIREKLAKIFEGYFNSGLEKILSGLQYSPLSEGYGHKRTSIEASNSNRKNKSTQRFFLASII